MLESAATRKLDHLRAEEKMLQRERQAEGDEFADKEEFVTDAYKQQMAEVRAAEEAENKRIGRIISITLLATYSCEAYRGREEETWRSTNRSCCPLRPNAQPR